MSVPVRATPPARDDIRRGERYFESRRAGLGTEFVDEVLATLDRIGDVPLGFGEVGESVRAVGLRRFGYVVYYRSDGSAAEVLAVLHGGRSRERGRAALSGESLDSVERGDLCMPRPNGRSAGGARMGPSFDERLNGVRWGEFGTAYGPAVKVPALLRRLAGTDRKAALDAGHELWCALCHQRVQVGSAALPPCRPCPSSWMSWTPPTRE